MRLPVSEGVVKTDRHTTFYLEAGAADGPPIVFVHGWPELSRSWRHQLPCFADLGFRAVAPDMRGYGRSGVYRRHEDYALEHAVRDMIELLDALGREKAFWVGHDWGSPVVWSLASHHPERCWGVANLCVPYLAAGFAPRNLLPLVDRSIYPEAEYPAGQWEYMLFYEERFDQACAAFDADPRATVKALFRKGSPSGKGKPSRTATARRDGGWFGGAGRAPDLPRDPDLVTDEDLDAYAAGLARHGFFGPDSWYERRRQRGLRGPGPRRGPVEPARPVPARRVRLHVRDGPLPAGRADAAGLPAPHRGGGAVGALDGAGEAPRGERGAREVDRHEAARRLAHALTERTR